MQLSFWVIIATVVILVIYDIIIGYYKGAPGTLSVAAYRAAQRWPATPFFFGMLLGHLYVSQNTYLYDISKAYPSIAFFGGFIFCFMFAVDHAVFRFAQKFPLFPLMCGIFAGNAFASLVF